MGPCPSRGQLEELRNKDVPWNRQKGLANPILLNSPISCETLDEQAGESSPTVRRQTTSEVARGVADTARPLASKSAIAATSGSPVSC